MVAPSLKIWTPTRGVVLLRPVKVRALAAFLALSATACGGFFEELQSAESVEGDSDGTDGDTEVIMGDCDFPVDDRCGDQDTIEQCDPTSLQYEVFDCTALCGDLTNLSCITTGTNQHGCYCVEPGLNKQLSCTELEACVASCAADASGACEDQCYARTTVSTVRLYGSLIYCANDECHDTCVNAPEACGTCIANTIAMGNGMCGLPRSVCDNDVNDDPNAPYG